MGIAIPFGFPRLSAKPNCDSFLRLQTLHEAKSQFILGFMDTPSMLIEDYFMLH